MLSVLERDYRQARKQGVWLCFQNSARNNIMPINNKQRCLALPLALAFHCPGDRQGISANGWSAARCTLSPCLSLLVLFLFTLTLPLT